jgi:hypothetical protein
MSAKNIKSCDVYKHTKNTFGKCVYSEVEDTVPFMLFSALVPAPPCVDTKALCAHLAD